MFYFNCMSLNILKLEVLKYISTILLNVETFLGCFVECKFKYTWKFHLMPYFYIFLYYILNERFQYDSLYLFRPSYWPSYYLNHRYALLNFNKFGARNCLRLVFLKFDPWVTYIRSWRLLTVQISLPDI